MSSIFDAVRPYPGPGGGPAQHGVRGGGAGDQGPRQGRGAVPQEPLQ